MLMSIFIAQFLLIFIKHYPSQKSENIPSSDNPSLPEWKALSIDDPSIVLFEQFQQETNKEWISSTARKDYSDKKNPADKDLLAYTGQWKIEQPIVYKVYDGDYGLVLKSDAKHHAIYKKFEKPLKLKEGQTLVLQYEIKYQKLVECGGAYIKLVAKDEKLRPEDFSSQTPYVIMFGPDRCGNTDKVHFIFNHYNPIKNKYEEKSFRETINTHSGRFSTLYTLVVYPDNTFKIKVNLNEMKVNKDNKEITIFNLFEDIEPPVVPPKEILQEVEDPKENDENYVPRMIDDPAAQMPDEWNQEEDGDWVAPQIPNPSYKKPEPRKIPNPEFYEDKTPYLFSEMGGVGFELWTMQGDILFDNIYVGTSEETANKVAKQTWKVKYDMENDKLKNDHLKDIKSTKFEWTVSNVVETVQFEIESFIFGMIDEPLLTIKEKYHVAMAFLLTCISTVYLFSKIFTKKKTVSKKSPDDSKKNTISKDELGSKNEE